MISPRSNAVPRPVRAPQMPINKPIQKNVARIALSGMPYACKMAISRRFWVICIKISEIVFMLATSTINMIIKNITYFSSLSAETRAGYNSCHESTSSVCKRVLSALVTVVILLLFLMRMPSSSIVWSGKSSCAKSRCEIIKLASYSSNPVRKIPETTSAIFCS